MALTKKLVYKETYYIIAICLGLICYEFIGLTFDYLDIIATVLSGALTAILFKVIKRRRN